MKGAKSRRVLEAVGTRRSMQFTRYEKFFNCICRNPALKKFTIQKESKFWKIIKNVVYASCARGEILTDLQCAKMCLAAGFHQDLMGSYSTASDSLVFIRGGEGR